MRLNGIAGVGNRNGRACRDTNGEECDRLVVVGQTGCRIVQAAGIVPVVLDGDGALLLDLGAGADREALAGVFAGGADRVGVFAHRRDLGFGFLRNAHGRRRNRHVTVLRVEEQRVHIGVAVGSRVFQGLRRGQRIINFCDGFLLVACALDINQTEGGIPQLLRRQRQSSVNRVVELRVADRVADRLGAVGVESDVGQERRQLRVVVDAVVTVCPESSDRRCRGVIVPVAAGARDPVDHINVDDLVGVAVVHSRAARVDQTVIVQLDLLNKGQTAVVEIGDVGIGQRADFIIEVRSDLDAHQREGAVLQRDDEGLVILRDRAAVSGNYGALRDADDEVGLAVSGREVIQGVVMDVDDHLRHEIIGVFDVIVQGVAEIAQGLTLGIGFFQARDEVCAADGRNQLKVNIARFRGVDQVHIRSQCSDLGVEVPVGLGSSACLVSDLQIGVLICRPLDGCSERLIARFIRNLLPIEEFSGFKLGSEQCLALVADDSVIAVPAALAAMFTADCGRGLETGYRIRGGPGQTQITLEAGESIGNCRVGRNQCRGADSRIGRCDCKAITGCIISHGDESKP